MTMARYRTMMELLFSVAILFQGCESDVRCRDGHGTEVDWYIVYKYPSGMDDLSYLYMDESTNGWKVNKKAINSTSGPLANTLKPLFDFYDRKTEGFGYMLYNDQPPQLPNQTKPQSVSQSYGHSKGVVMLDKQTGVWLSHSTPGFPVYQNKDFWPNSGNMNAQIFMCVTYSYKTFKEIALQLEYIHGYSYDSNISTTFHEELLCVAQRDCYPKQEPWFSVKTLTSMGGQSFSSYAKYTRFGDDLYSGLIVKFLEQNLYVKSWGKMRCPLPSTCTPEGHHVNNVVEVKLPKRKFFKSTVDHSKWCVTPDGNWTCIADMNREMSQMKRAGGAICTENVAVAKAFNKIVKLCDTYKPAPYNHDAHSHEL
ncbi:deoxyribonuclease-2-alpha-like [Pseudoliparis swirei]|uniref:deoxyribonuclease-2-alpha-like n=1 Tax=Pseudoliparis swirei TaxID=2059687 RepID=UPI0024BDEA40|nr:deoxyribonuclease-2-alpha-like [Pseudoliparis swirei]